jgi:ubiquinone/menaquinone biosynthesis C-methylase UbiE
MIKYNNTENKCGTMNEQTRDKWIENILKDIPTGKRILDAGAGEMKYKKLCNHLDYISQDFSQYNGSGDTGLQFGKWDTNGIDIVSDINDIPLPDESFDYIMCLEVLEHVSHPQNTIKELTRLLKPKGFLIISAPFCSITHMSPYYFYTGFSKNFYKEWLKKFNLDVIDLQYNGNYFEYLAQELRRLPYIAKNYSTFEIDNNATAIQEMLNILNELSKNNKGSEELLSFGLQIISQKE